jgi:competence protein ComFC
VQCRSQPPTFNALRSWCAYKENSRQAIHRLKYSRDVGLAEALAQQVCQLAGSLSWPVDVVTSVPLNPARLKQRGYNQSSLLGLPVALALGVAFRPGLLSRTRDTATQVGLSAEERKNNVKGAFSAGLSTGRNVLIIDDVITTGATMNACALALRSAGASSVYGLSFARALLSDDQVRSDPIS